MGLCEGEMTQPKGSTWCGMNIGHCQCFKLGRVSLECGSLQCFTRGPAFFCSPVRTLCAQWSCHPQPSPELETALPGLCAPGEGVLLCGSSAQTSPTPATSASCLLLKPTSIRWYSQGSPCSPPCSSLPAGLCSHAPRPVPPGHLAYTALQVPLPSFSLFFAL